MLYCGWTDSRTSTSSQRGGPPSSPGTAQEARLESSGSPTLGGDGVLGTAGSGGLGAVAAGALKRVPAAPLGIKLEAPRQGQGQFLTSLHLLSRLQVGGERQMSHRGRESPDTPRAFLHSSSSGGLNRTPILLP